MTQNNLIINKISFTPATDEIEFNFTAQETEGLYRFHVTKLPENTSGSFTFPDPKKLFLYTNFTSDLDNSIAVKISLKNQKSIARSYYSYLIHSFLINHADITLPNFIKDNEFWFLANDLSTSELNIYRKFTIRVAHNYNTDNPELIISFDGISKVFMRSIEELISDNIDTRLFKKVTYNKLVYKFDELPDEANYHFNEIYPILNIELTRELQLPFDTPDTSNRYEKYYSQLESFFSKYINTAEFKSVINHSGKWQEIDPEKVFRTPYSSNSLLFGQEHRDTYPYDGMKTGGPYKPAGHKHIKIFFIVHEADKETAKEFHNYIVGQKGFIAFNKFLKLSVNYEKEKHITFTDKDNPFQQIQEQLLEKDFDPDVKYLAFYISPFNKEELDYNKHSCYFKVKEALLYRGITSQVIERESIYNPSFKFFLSNIGIAVLAKLDGIPWRLDCELNNELIVGIGAFKAQSAKCRYIGSAFCFSNDGSFKGFDSYPASDTTLLAGSIGEAVQNYCEKNPNLERLVIHFYKTMSRKELTPILKVLKKLEVEIPVIIISISKTESKDLVIFDKSYKGLMPYSGTYTPVGYNKYLLCNNTRYNENQKKAPESYPLPIKIHIQSTDEEIIKNMEELRKLIDQTYQFSRMYWKSVKQQNLPVTIKYPEMIAEVFPHFESSAIPDFGKNNLWFL